MENYDGAIPPDFLVEKIKVFSSGLTEEQVTEFLDIESDYVDWLVEALS